MLKHTDAMPTLAVPGTSKTSPITTTPENGSETSGPQATQGAGRRRRKANFSSEEVDILVREVSSRRFILFGSAVNGRSDLGCAAAKATEKLAAWRAVATSVNSANRGEPRTVREIRKKWENVTSTFRKRQLGDMGTTIELEPHILSGGRCPMDEVLACARAYQANRIMQQQRRSAAAATSPFMEAFQTDENHIKEDYTSSDDDLILDIQPDVHIESLETPLTFTDSDDVNSRNDNDSTRKNVHHNNIDSVSGALDSSEGETSTVRYHGNRQLLQLQQQLRSGEVIISPAVQHGDVIGNGTGKRDRESSINQQPCTTASNIVRKQSIEEQKLAVMKQLLKVETKRLKVEKKRLKIEKIRLRMLQSD